MLNQKKTITLSIILITILCGIILRIYNLNYENFWFDEILTFYISEPDISFEETKLRYNAIESIPIFYYLIIQFLHEIIGYYPEVSRYFSLILGVLSIFTVGYLTKQISKNNSYILAIYLVSFNIYLIAYSQEARVYIFTFFLVTLSLIYYFRLYSSLGNQNFNLLFFNLFQILSFLSHPLTIILFFSITFFYLYELRSIKSKNKYILISILFPLFFLVFYIPYYLNNAALSVSWIELPDWKFYTNFYFSKFFGSRLLGAIHLFVLIYLIFILRKKLFAKNRFILFLIIFLLLSYFLPIIYSYIFQPLIFPRYIIFVLIPIITLLSVLIYEIKNKFIKNCLILTFVVITFGNHFTENTFKQFTSQINRTKPDFVSALNYISSENNKNIIYSISYDEENRQVIKALNQYLKFLKNKEKIDVKILTINEKNSLNKNSFWKLCLTIISDCNANFKGYRIEKIKSFNSIRLNLLRKQK